MKFDPAIVGFVKKELTQALRDKRMRGMLIFMPIVQLLMFGYALSSEIRNIGLASVYRPGDSFSRELTDRFYSSGWFSPRARSAGDPLDWVRSGRAEAVLVAPADGGDKAFGRGDASYQLLIDATNAERARGVDAYAQSVMAEQIAARRGTAPAPPFRFVVRTLYNPAEDTATYLVPGTLCLMMFLVPLSFTMMAITREREMGTLETILASPITPGEVMLGKTVPYVVLGMLQLPVLLTVAWLMGVPVRAPLWEITMTVLVFVSTTVAVGFLLSTFLKTQQQAMLGSFLFMFPMIQLSGVIYPVENMPAAIRWIPYLNPLRYVVICIRHLMLKGGDLGAILPNLGALLLIGAGALFTASRRFRQTLN
jgi:ABC-2 type transport system permease protein